MAKMFSPKAPPAPAPLPVTPMPDENAINAAKKKSILQQMSRQGGRDSTILSDKEGL